MGSLPMPTEYCPVVGGKALREKSERILLCEREDVLVDETEVAMTI
jgi:hypothetical protein